MINIIKIANKPKLNCQKLGATILLAFLLVSAFFFLMPKIEMAKADTLTFGKTSIGGNSDAVNQGIVFGSRFIAPNNGTVTDINAYVYGLQAGQAQALIFSDSAGLPGALIASSSTQSIIEAPLWWDFGGLSLPVTQGSAYWLCLLSGSSGGPYFYYFDQGGTNQLVIGTLSSQNTLQNPTLSNFQMSIYANFTTSSTASPTPSPISTPTPTPVITPAPVSTPTPASTPNPSATATSTPTPISTLAPTSSPTVTSTPTPTSTTTSPTETPFASPIESSTPTPSVPEFSISYVLAGIAFLVVVIVLATLILVRRKK